MVLVVPQQVELDALEQQVEVDALEQQVEVESLPVQQLVQELLPEQLQPQEQPQLQPQPQPQFHQPQRRALQPFSQTMPQFTVRMHPPGHVEV